MSLQQSQYDRLAGGTLTQLSILDTSGQMRRDNDANRRRINDDFFVGIIFSFPRYLHASGF